MSSMNRVILVGRLGADPTEKEAKNGKSVVLFSLATHEYSKRDGEDKTTWHKVVTFGKTAEVCAKYLQKGRSVCVEGTLQKRQYNDDEGNSRSTTEIKADRIHFIDQKKSAPDLQAS